VKDSTNGRKAHETSGRWGCGCIRCVSDAAVLDFLAGWSTSLPFGCVCFFRCRVLISFCHISVQLLVCLALVNFIPPSTLYSSPPPSDSLINWRKKGRLPHRSALFPSRSCFDASLLNAYGVSRCWRADISLSATKGRILTSSFMLTVRRFVLFVCVCVCVCVSFRC